MSYIRLRQVFSRLKTHIYNLLQLLNCEILLQKPYPYPLGGEQERG